MKHHVTASSWFDRALLVIVAALILVGVLEHYAQKDVNHREICAIRAYIEGQFAISAGVPGADPKVVAARRRVIQTFEDRMDGNCQ